jgi:hypothetical protein
MQGNYRYEEERHLGQRGMTRRGGFGERERDDDEIQQQEEERLAGGPVYGRESRAGRFQPGTEGSWSRQGGREYDRSLGGRDFYEGYDDYGGHLSSQRAQTDFQSHVGKGPKGWQRSDERIREELNEALARHPEIDATDVEVRVANCEVTLAGTVTDRRTKRLAEDVAERVFGVKDVQNQIRVQPSTEGSSQDRIAEREMTRAPYREGRVTEAQADQSRKERGKTKGASAR